VTTSEEEVRILSGWKDTHHRKQDIHQRIYYVYAMQQADEVYKLQWDLGR
jgi:hypothetical protein